MKPVDSGQWSVVSSWRQLFGLLLIAYCFQACSIPNLEQPECDQARDRVREFYSFHFGNELAFSPENLEMRKGFLTPRFFDSLRTSPPAIDPFTQTDDVPKAFRVGECRLSEAGRRTAFGVLLFWKTDTRTDQRMINVEAENIDGTWLIDRVSN